MKFGVREICDVVFKAKTAMTIGDAEFKKGQPVLYIDTATASTLEQATTTVYAQGGRGNTRLVAWEGEKQVTFTVTDALLSPIGLSILSGAGLFKASNETTKVHVHTTARATVEKNGSGKEIIDLSAVLGEDEQIDAAAPVFISVVEEDGSLTGTMLDGFVVCTSKSSTTAADQGKFLANESDVDAGKNVFIDFYITKLSKNVSEVQIDAASFGGNFYVEASTLFRQTNGLDLPAEITIPNVKIQSNFTFSMAATGDPSTFDFTMDAFPDYTMFDRSHKVICVIQIVEDVAAGSTTKDSVMKHGAISIDESYADSTASQPQSGTLG